MSRRDELLQLADALWRERGYAGFSYADLSKGTGLHKATIHHHFSKKEALVAALVETHLQRAIAFGQAVAPLAPEVRLRRFVELYASLLDTPDQLCAAGSISADLHVLPPDVAALGRRYLDGQRAWLVATLREGPWTSDPEDLADTVLSSVQGGLQRARAQGEPERLRAVLRSLASWLNLPGPVPGCGE